MRRMRGIPTEIRMNNLLANELIPAIGDLYVTLGHVRGWKGGFRARFTHHREETLQ